MTKNTCNDTHSLIHSLTHSLTHSLNKDPKFQQITFKIRQQTSIDSILFDSSLQAVVIKAPDVDSASIARKLVETNLRNQMRLQSIEIKLQETQNELFNKQGEIASGMTMEVLVKKELVGFVIGKSGAHVNEVNYSLNLPIKFSTYSHIHLDQGQV